jgi:environmental stress-induced protein Ves
MNLKYLEAATYERTRWKNNQGWTSEILRLPQKKDTHDYSVRISIAEITQDSNFSRFDGFDRSLMLLEGQGLNLYIAEQSAPFAELKHSEQTITFPGELQISCKLHNGPTSDFNVFTRRSIYQHCLESHLFHKNWQYTVKPNTYYLWYLLRGNATLTLGTKSISWKTGDSVLLQDSQAVSQKLSATGSGALIVVSWATAQ